MIISYLDEDEDTENQRGVSDDESDNDSDDVPVNPRRDYIHLNPDLPVEWKEIEEEDSEIACNSMIILLLLGEIYNQLGPLAVLLFKRVNKLKLIGGMNRDT